MNVIPPGAMIGILGGGQLGRMIALAAARLGYHCAILAPEDDCPAAELASIRIKADYRDAGGLREFAAVADVVTVEWENVPVEALAQLASGPPVRPSAALLRVTQDRLLEKRAVQEAGAATADYWPVATEAELEAALACAGGSGILKTRRLGYDGRGQLRIGQPGEAAAAWAALGQVPLILERVVDIACELSVISGRTSDGRVASYAAVANHHEGGILRRSIAPAPVATALAAAAVQLAQALTEALEVEGLLAVEMFVTTDDRLLVNELAPRPHNSGHWTIDACAISQFELLVRAICGLPLGDLGDCRPAVMDNLLGDELHAWPQLLAEPGARLHIYGKGETRAGRKMGHVTRLARATGSSPL